METKDGINLSIVIPVYNEEGNIAKLDQEIKDSVSKITPDFEVIYVNDGSADNTLQELKKLNNITIINLNRNYGQATALDAGFRACAGDYVVSLDGDGQNDPADIPLLLEKLKNENLDVVTGWRKNRKDSSSINILTRIGRFFRHFLIGDTVHDTGCTLRVYTKEAVGYFGSKTRAVINASSNSGSYIKDMTLKQLVEMLLQIGAIASDKIDAAKKLVGILQ